MLNEKCFLKADNFNVVFSLEYLGTDITETCLGSLYLQQGKGIQKNCKFEISAEQVFRLAHNKWAIATQKQFTTHQVYGMNRKPVTVGPGTTITLEPGCKI